MTIGRPFWMGYVAPPGPIFEDQFNYGPAIPDPTKWNILSGTPQVNGSALVLVPSIPAEGIQAKPTFSPYLRLVTGFKMTASANPAALILSDGIFGGEYISFVQVGGVVRFTSNTAGGTDITHVFWIPYINTFAKIEIIWTATKIEFYVNDVLKATHTMYVPSNTMYMDIKGNQATANVEFDYVEVWQ